MISHADRAGAMRDGIALLRAYLASDARGAARLIASLEPHEVLLVLGALLQLGAGFLQDLNRMTAEPTDVLLEQLLADLQRRTT